MKVRNRLNCFRVRSLDRGFFGERVVLVLELGFFFVGGIGWFFRSVIFVVLVFV